MRARLPAHPGRHSVRDEHQCAGQEVDGHSSKILELLSNNIDRCSGLSFLRLNDRAHAAKLTLAVHQSRLSQTGTAVSSVKHQDAPQCLRGDSHPGWVHDERHADLTIEIGAQVDGRQLVEF